MNGLLKLVAPLAAALAIAACNASTSSNMPATSGASQTGTQVSTHSVPAWEAKHQARRACKDLAGGVSCFALLSTHAGPLACSPSSSCGFRPIDLQTRYKLAPLLGNGGGTIVAVIELGDLPTAATDLAAYRSQYSVRPILTTRRAAQTSASVLRPTSTPRWSLPSVPNARSI